MLRLLQMAAGVALPTNDTDVRGFWLGAIGVRKDGTIVASRNGAAQFCETVENYQLIPTSHAEGRCLRKLDKHGTMYVARVSRKDHSLQLAKPCRMCRTRIKSAQINKVYYTIDNNSYGLWLPASDEYRVFQD